MFFDRWRYAIRIVEKFEGDIKSPLATELIDMIIWGAKNLTARKQLKKIDCVIIAANGICYNATARDRLSKELNLDDEHIRNNRTKLRDATADFARQHNRLHALTTIETNQRPIP